MFLLARCHHHQRRNRLLLQDTWKRTQRQRLQLNVVGISGQFSGISSLPYLPQQHQQNHHQQQRQFCHCTANTWHTIQQSRPLLHYDRTRVSYFSVLPDEDDFHIEDNSTETPESSVIQLEPSSESNESIMESSSSLIVNNKRDQFIQHLVHGIQVNVQGIVHSVDARKNASQKSLNESIVVKEEADADEEKEEISNSDNENMKQRTQKSLSKRWNNKRSKEKRRLGKLAMFSKRRQQQEQQQYTLKHTETTTSLTMIPPTMWNLAEKRDDDDWDQLWKAATAQNDDPTLITKNNASTDGSDDDQGDSSNSVSSATFDPTLNEGKTIQTATASISKDDEEDIIDALAQSIALLSIMSTKDWAMIDATDAVQVLDLLREEQLGGVDDVIIMNNSEKEDIQQEDIIREISDLLGDARMGNYVLTTIESNLLLSRLVTTTVKETNDVSIISPDIFMGAALQLYEEMIALGDSGREDCAPDETTYKLLLLALDKRFLARSEAVRLFQNMINASSPKVKFSADTFLMGMQTCYRHGDLAVAQDCMQTVLDDENGNVGSFRPPAGVYLILSDMLQKQHAWRDAIKLLDVALKPSAKLKDSEIDRILLSLSRWNLKARRGDVLGPSMFLLEILDRLERRDANNQISDFVVWSNIIDRLSRFSKLDESMWKHVVHAFNMLWIAHPDCHPGRKLLRIGIEASEATSDGRLASQVIFNEVAKHAPSPFAAAFQTKLVTNTCSSMEDDHDTLGEEKLNSSSGDVNTVESPPVQRRGNTGSPIPPSTFRKGLEICMSTGDIDSANLILHSFEKLSSFFPLGQQTEFYGLALMAYAQVGDSEAAKSLLQAMKIKGMKLSEKHYGSVMHCLATNECFDEAYSLLESMRSGLNDDEVQPGVTCYNAILLSHLRSRSWEDALRLQEMMKESGITPDASTAQGLLLASYGIGGKKQTLTCLEDLLDAEVHMGQETFNLAAKILLPKESNGGMTDVRDSLREIVDTVPHMRSIALDFMRSIRIAEVEQKRKPSKGQPAKRLDQKRSASWCQAMRRLISYVQASSGDAGG